jgi:hypothetical protein
MFSNVIYLPIEGQFIVCCCIQAGSCGEKSCPTLCAFAEGCICNFAAVSASRAYVMEKYDLASEPCDYRLIRINNCLQWLACICNILAMIEPAFQDLARYVCFIVFVLFSGFVLVPTS